MDLIRGKLLRGSVFDQIELIRLNRSTGIINIV